MPLLKLGDPVQYLRSVGPARAELLAALGVRTVGDLLHYFPWRMDYRPPVQPIAELRRKIDEVITAGGTIVAGRWGGRPWKAVFTAKLQDSTGSLEVVWFNASWLRDRVHPHDRIVVSGKLRRGPHGPQLVNPKMKVVIGDAPLTEEIAEKWEPVYPASADLASRQIRTMVQRNLPRMLRLVDEPFWPAYLRQRKLLDRRLAVAWMHFPNMDDAPPKQDADSDILPLQPDLPQEQMEARAKAALRRLAWDEAFLFQLALAIRRRTRQTTQRAVALPCDARIRDRILKRFPFTLTAAQIRATDEIVGDLASPVPMNRLLQGDVGSGKTAVALFAALVAVAHGQQAAVMAPTDILARQHFARVRQYLADSRVRIALLTGSVTASERRDIHHRIGDGDLDLVIGTTSLISEGVRFARLALLVIDEQHKFGVQQRSELRERGAAASRDSLPPVLSALPDAAAPGLAPHTLVMTATPIPRSLALTVFGDLAVSIIDELPPGRGRLDTRVVNPTNRDAAFDFIASRLAAGGQAYVVCPRIKASQPDAPLDLDEPDDDREQAPSAEQAYEELAPRFRQFGVALVHGQMPRDRQQQALADFACGRVRVLVATTVIEVGVDVAKANIMAVLGAQRFGLAQLHQLRGRVGRGSDNSRSYCLLFVDDDDAAARLAILEQTRDGFRIAEEDLARRGPGRFFGLAQHGLPEFQFLNLATDLGLLRTVRADAFALVNQDPRLGQPRLATLRRQLQAQYSRLLPLIDAG